MPGLFGEDRIRRVAEAALTLPGADGVEVLLLHEWGGLTRFANSTIHQSTWREDSAVRVRVVLDGRIGVAGTNLFTPEGARRAAEDAREIAEVSAPDPLFPGLAPPDPVPAKDGYDQAVADASPQRRAAWVADLIAPVGTGFRAAGAAETKAVEVAVANTEGQFCYAPLSEASISTVVSGGDGGTGTAEQTVARAGEVDPEGVGGRAFAKARDSAGPRDATPGRYQVVLEPLAVAALAEFLAYLAFGGRAIAEGRSPLAQRVGERVCSPSVTIRDDALSPEALGLPFDFEGTPKRDVTLIEDGVFRRGVHDRRSAKQAGTASTGHALPPPNPEGAYPTNLTLEAGDATLQDLIGGVERGLLVTRFHYTNIVHPMETVITGMTRDGTWMVERGEIAYPVRNLRFTQSILEALSQVEAIGDRVVAAGEFVPGGTRVPALRLGSFNFSSASDH